MAAKDRDTVVQDVEEVVSSMFDLRLHLDRDIDKDSLNQLANQLRDLFQIEVVSCDKCNNHVAEELTKLNDVSQKLCVDCQNEVESRIDH